MICAILGREALDPRAEAEDGAALGAPGGEAFAELEAVAALLGREVDAAGKRLDARPERRHEVQAPLAVERAELEAERPLALRERDRLIQALLVRIDLERAAFDAVVRDAGIRADLLQRVQAVERQAQHVPGVVPGGPGPRAAQELEPPAPHPRDLAGMDQDRRVGLRERPQRLERHPRRRPRHRLADRDEAAVRMAALARDPRLAVDQHHLVAVLKQVVGGGDADHAGAEHDHLHRSATPPFPLIAPDPS